MQTNLALLVRSYTPKPEEVEDRAQRALKVALDTHKLTGSGPMFHTIAFLVPRSHDCGGTAKAIRLKLAAANLDRVIVIEASGHHSCGALNAAALVLRARGNIGRLLIVSGKAASYVNEGVLEKIDSAFAERAKIVGMTVDELAGIVREGRVQNTFCAWDLGALLDVGAFDSETGVEEIAPTVRLARKYGPCIAILDSPGGKLDILESETARARHDEVMRTKGSRQQAEVERLGTTFLFLKAGIMSGYPKAV